MSRSPKLAFPGEPKAFPRAENVPRLKYPSNYDHAALAFIAGRARGRRETGPGRHVVESTGALPAGSRAYVTADRIAATLGRSAGSRDACASRMIPAVSMTKLPPSCFTSAFLPSGRPSQRRDPFSIARA